MKKFAVELTDLFNHHGWRIDDLHTEAEMPLLGTLSIKIKASRTVADSGALADVGMVDPKLQAVATAAAELQRALNNYAKELRVDVNAHYISTLSDTERRLVYEVYIERTQTTRVHGAPRP